MRILLALDWFLFYASGLANALAREHEVHLLFREDAAEVAGRPDPPALRAFMAGAVHPGVVLHPFRGRPLDPTSAGEALRIRRLTREIDPDILHLQATADWRLVLLALSRGRRTVVTTLHDVTAHPGERRPFREILTRLLLWGSGGVILHGEALRDRFLLLHPSLARDRELAVISHGVMESYGREAPGVKEEPFTLLFFGRLHPYKGLDTLLRAVPLLAREFPEVRVIVAGEGPAFRAELAEAGRDTRFELHRGFVPPGEVAGLFARAAVIVLPYREASQSGVIPLAAQFGKPVVATRVGSLPEAVEEGGSGLLVPPDDPPALAAAVGMLLRDPALRGRMGQKAGQMAAGTFGWERLARETIAFYRRVARGEGRG